MSLGLVRSWWLPQFRSRLRIYSRCHSQLRAVVAVAAVAGGSQLRPLAIPVSVTLPSPRIGEHGLIFR